MQKFRTVSILDKSLSRGKNEVSVLFHTHVYWFTFYCLTNLDQLVHICVAIFGDGQVCIEQGKFSPRATRQVILKTQIFMRYFNYNTV